MFTFVFGALSIELPRIEQALARERARERAQGQLPPLVLLGLEIEQAQGQAAQAQRLVEAGVARAQGKIVPPETECVVCLDGLDNSDRDLCLTSCQHWFHKACILGWLESRVICPICGNVNLDEM